MIERLVAFDMDGTLMNTPLQEVGMKVWSLVKGTPYPHKGWWGRPESLDLDVFDIKPFPSMLKQLEKELSTPNTCVIILTSRMNKLRPQVQAVLDANNIDVDYLDMKYDGRDKGQKILSYIEQMPDLEEVSVFDDRICDIDVYRNIRGVLPINITYNIYQVHNGNFVLVK